MTKNAPVNYSSVVEMTRKYPFSTTQPQSRLKYTRTFHENEYPQLRTRIQTQSKLQHNCLIRILKAFESKKNHYFDIFYERVPYSLRDIVFELTHQELVSMRDELLSFTTYLIYVGIYPVIADELLGVTNDKRIKLFVDVDYMNVSGNYENLTKAKKIEIFNIFQIYQEITQKNKKVQDVNQLTYSISPYRKQQIPTILNVQYNIHHNTSPPHHQQLVKRERVNLRETNCKIALEKVSGLDYLKGKPFQKELKVSSMESPVPTTNFSGAASKISEIDIFKYQQLDKQKEIVKLYRQNKFQRQLSNNSRFNSKQDIGVQRMKAQSLRHTFDNQHRLKAISKKQQLRMSFDYLGSKLARLKLALGNEKDIKKLKQMKKQETLRNIKTGKMHLQEMDNVISEDGDNEETRMEMNGLKVVQQKSHWKNEDWNQVGEQRGTREKQKSDFEKIFEKVRKAIDKTEMTFRKYEETRTK